MVFDREKTKEEWIQMYDNLIKCGEVVLANNLLLFLDKYGVWLDDMDESTMEVVNGNR